MKRPRWPVYLLSVPAGGLLGAVAFYLGAIASFGLGMVSSYGIGRYWWQPSLIGAAFGILQAPFVCSLRGRGRLAVVLPGLAMFLIWMPISVSWRPLDFSMPLHLFKMTVGQSLIWGLSAALTAHWTLSALNALEGGVHVSRRLRTAALAAAGILLALGILASAQHDDQSGEPKRVCQQFAAAFAAGDADTALSFFSLGPYSRLDADNARYWFAMAMPFLPVGGRVRIVQWPYFRPKAGRCVCRARIVGASYRLPPTVEAQDATFEVIVQRYSAGWKVDPPERALETYLASLYGEQAGRSWQRFLVTTPVPRGN